MLRRAFLLLEVELELGGLQDPVFAPRLAGGVGRVRQPVAVEAEDLDALGLAVRGALALQDVMRILEYAAFVLRAEEKPRAEKPVGAALQAHAALALDDPELAVVAQELAEDGDVLAPDLGVAARCDLEIGNAVDRLGFDRGAVGLGLRLRRGLRRDRRGRSQRERERREAKRHDAGRIFPWC